MRDRKWLYLLIGCIIGLAACGPTPPDPTETPALTPTNTPPPVPTIEPTPTPLAAPEGVYRIAILGDITTTNVWALYGPEGSTWNYAVQGDYWPSLFTYSDRRFELIPALAEDFATPLEQEGDLWASTVTLKQGALWSDGSQITAGDVAFTVNTALALGLGGNWVVYDGNYVARAEEVDIYTVRFIYHTRPGLARHEFGALMGPIVNRAFWEPRVADALVAFEGLDPSGTAYALMRAHAQQMVYAIDSTGEPTGGSWMLDRREPGAYVENVAHPAPYFMGAVVEQYANGAYREYRQGAYDFFTGDPGGELELTFVRGPHLDTVRYSIYSPSVALLALQNGDVDFALNPSGWSADQLQQIRDDPHITVISNPANSFRYLAFNFGRPPLDDVAIRQAIDCMIDRTFLTRDLMQGQAVEVLGPVPEGNVFWHNPDLERPCEGGSAEERLNWAVQRLSDAGYTWRVAPVWNPSRGGSVDWGEGLRLPNGSDFPAMTLLAPNPGHDPLRATVNVYIEQWINQLGIPVTVQLLDFDAVRTTVFETDAWDMYVLSWDLSVYPSYVCDFFVTGAGFNVLNYSNPQLDELCAAFYAADTLETARHLNFTLQELLVDDLPYVYLFTTPIVDVYRNDTVSFPYTDVLGGLSGGYGFQGLVRPTR